MASLCNFPNFNFALPPFPALPAFSLPALPIFTLAFSLPCMLD